MKLTKSAFMQWHKKYPAKKDQKEVSFQLALQKWEQWDKAVNQIFNIQRQPEFFCQCAYESNYFKTDSENLYYTKPDRILKIFKRRVRTLTKAKKLTKNPEALAKAVYSNILGNDSPKAKKLYRKGWTCLDFRGQGYIQLTGFNNWMDFKKKTGLDPFKNRQYFIDFPWRGAGFFWVRNSLDFVPSMKDMTRIINGTAQIGLKKREALFKELLNIMKNN